MGAILYLPDHDIPLAWWHVVLMMVFIAVSLIGAYLFSGWLTCKKHPEFFDEKGHLKRPGEERE